MPLRSYFFTGMEANDDDTLVLDSSCELFGVQQIGQFGVVVGLQLVVLFLPMQVVPTDVAHHVSHARENHNPKDAWR